VGASGFGVGGTEDGERGFDLAPIGQQLGGVASPKSEAATPAVPTAPQSRLTVTSPSTTMIKNGSPSF